MLWSRSASLIRTTRMSSAIARNIFRMFSACCCSWVWVLNFDSLVTPSTSRATSGPKPLLDVGQAVLGVLRDVVEERRLDGDRVDAEVGEDLGRGDRVGDVRLARRAVLPGVGLDGQVERPADRARGRPAGSAARARRGGPRRSGSNERLPSPGRRRRRAAARGLGRGRAALGDGFDRHRVQDSSVPGELSSGSG